LCFHFTPKHGSWLNMTEIEPGVLSRVALNQCIPDATHLNRILWTNEAHRNKKQATVNWQFTPADTRTKLRRLYPSISD
jgi:hypothetical protein